MDAKDISTNFNRKGAYQATAKGQKMTSNAYVAGATAEFFHDLWTFINPGVQSLSLTSHNAREHFTRTVAAYSMHFALGAAWPLLTKMILDLLGSDDKYEDLADWDRKSGLCIPTGKGTWVKIPLSIETSAAWETGQLFAAYFLGHDELKDGKNPIIEWSGALASLVPVDPLSSGGENYWVSMSPTLLSPLMQHATNSKWTGAPLQKEDTPWNKNDAEWTKAFGSVNPITLRICKELSDMTSVAHDSDIIKGWWDWSPAVMDNYIKGYTGGVGQLFADMAKTAGGIVEGDVDVSGVPIMRRFVAKTDDDAERKRVDNRYYKAQSKWDERKKALDKAKKRRDDTPTAKATYIDLKDMWGEQLERYKQLSKRLKELYKMREEPASEEEADMIEKSIIAIKKEISSL